MTMITAEYLAQMHFALNIGHGRAAPGLVNETYKMIVDSGIKPYVGNRPTLLKAAATLADGFYETLRALDNTVCRVPSSSNAMVTVQRMLINKAVHYAEDNGFDSTFVRTAFDTRQAEAEVNNKDEIMVAIAHGNGVMTLITVRDCDADPYDKIDAFADTFGRGLFSRAMFCWVVAGESIEIDACDPEINAYLAALFG